MYHKKHFKIEEAQDLLTNLIPNISEMIKLTKTLREKNYDIYKHVYFSGIGSNGTGIYPEEINRLIDIVKDISEKGIMIKEIERGLLDFPHNRKNGEEVYLCWEFGEEKILYWHGIREGFNGRKSLEDI